jgi:hypothetical protein
MVRLIIFTVFLFSAWRWGDWKNWTRYYSTILFVILVSILETLITHNHFLWKFHPDPFMPFLYNHFLISIAMAFVVFSSTVLIYLGNYPKNKKQFAYVLMWVLIYSVVEVITSNFGLLSYHNGWSIFWSVVINIIMFPLIRLHYTRPLLTWFITFGVFAFFWVKFDLSP